MELSELIMWLGWILAAYVMGSIPVGVIIGRTQGINIREHGSRNVGATNVMRVMGKRLGLLCFVLDMLKGSVPVLLAGMVTGALGRTASQTTTTVLVLWLAVAVAAVLGHMASVFLKFVGGKGVATGFGAMLGMWPLLTLPALAALIIWIITLRLSRYVSVSSMLAALSLPLLVALGTLLHPSAADDGGTTIDGLIQAWPVIVMTALLALAVVWKHRTNIRRLRRGEEPRVGSARTSRT